ncbi:hypothetical protein BASA81_010883 [Batrachochytrium salamandrivorans]|nr:hypothetical protein BASA81_010883 [Batrachochytrium salamandrivorans]
MGPSSRRTTRELESTAKELNEKLGFSLGASSLSKIPHLAQEDSNAVAAKKKRMVTLHNISSPSELNIFIAGSPENFDSKQNYYFSQLRELPKINRINSAKGTQKATSSINRQLLSRPTLAAAPIPSVEARRRTSPDLLVCATTNGKHTYDQATGNSRTGSIRPTLNSKSIHSGTDLSMAQADHSGQRPESDICGLSIPSRQTSRCRGFGKTATGRLLADSCGNVKSTASSKKQQQHSQDLLSVMLVGQRVAPIPDEMESTQMHTICEDEIQTQHDQHTNSISSGKAVTDNKFQLDSHVCDQHLNMSHQGIQSGPICLAPIIVAASESSDEEKEDATDSDALIVSGDIDPYNFDNIDDVDQIGSRYAFIIESRIRKMRGEDVPTPPPMSPMDMEKFRRSPDANDKFREPSLLEERSSKNGVTPTSVVNGNPNPESHLGTIELAPIEISYRLSSAAKIPEEIEPLQVGSIGFNMTLPSQTQNSTVTNRPVAVGPFLDCSTESLNDHLEKDDHDPIQEVGTTPLRPPSSNTDLLDIPNYPTSQKGYWRSAMPKSRNLTPRKHTLQDRLLHPHGSRTATSSSQCNFTRAEASTPYSNEHYLISGEKNATFPFSSSAETAERNSLNRLEPLTPKSDISNMFHHDIIFNDEVVSSWQEDMVVRSIKLITENRKILATINNVPSGHSLPYVKYAIADARMENYRPYFPAKSSLNITAGLHSLVTNLEKDNVESPKKTSLPNQKSKAKKRNPGDASMSNEIYEDSTGAQRLTTNIGSHEVLEKQQSVINKIECGMPISRNTSKYDLKIDGSRMYLEIGEIGRRISPIGTSILPANAVLPIPALSFQHHRRISATINPTTGTLRSFPHESQVYKLENPPSLESIPAKHSRNATREAVHELATTDNPVTQTAPLDERDISVEDYNQSVSYNNVGNISGTGSSDIMHTSYALGDWVSADQLIYPVSMEMPLQNLGRMAVAQEQQLNDLHMKSTLISSNQPTILPQSNILTDAYGQQCETQIAATLACNNSICEDDPHHSMKVASELDVHTKEESVTLSIPSNPVQNSEIIQECVHLSEQKLGAVPALASNRNLAGLTSRRRIYRTPNKKQKVIFVPRHISVPAIAGAAHDVDAQSIKTEDPENDTILSDDCTLSTHKRLEPQSDEIDIDIAQKSSQLDLIDPTDPIQFYAIQRKKSFAAAGICVNESHLDISSSRPIIGVPVSIQTVDTTEAILEEKTRKCDLNDDLKTSYEGSVGEYENSAILANRKLLLHALQANGFVLGAGKSMYQIVHDVDRRLVGMNCIERARYPTFDDPGSPLDATGTPIITFDGMVPKGMSTDDMASEVEFLDKAIAAASIPTPTYHRKRGIILARLGRFNHAMEDLNIGVKYDEFNSDAYWHRHQLYLRHNDVENALRDLNSITDNNKMHLGAFQSKARIYQALGIIKLAIVNYSAVIRLKVDGADGYYNRACLFEMENEMVYANEDFRMVRSLDPSNSHAIYNEAIDSFQKQLWEDSVQAFSKLIALNGENSQAFMYRGRAYASVAKFENALDDISTAIRISPGRPQYFFHRGCLLLSRNPTRAIQDLSTSILLDDSSCNSDSFFQRAKIYQTIGKPDLAIADYMAVIELDPTKSKAYLNLGILHMRFYAEYDKALYLFNKSIANDPNNLQTYLCRAELYQLLHLDEVPGVLDVYIAGNGLGSRHSNKGHATFGLIGKAIKDYNRAIHLCPNNFLLFLYRGRLLLKQGFMTEAAMDFHAAFDLNSNIAQTFIQRALVLCFQRKYKQVIDEFEEHKKTQMVDDSALLLLISKARIRCGDFKGALHDLTNALDFSQNDPQTFLLRGICFEHLSDWSAASLEFSKCIAFMPTYSKAYYHRGLCKLYEGNDSGVIDLDMAIKYNKKFFEAFLTRASYYHSKAMYVQGIEDCNEAIKLEPTSIKSHLLRGASKCKLNQYALAILDFTKAIGIDKTSHFAFYNRAVTYQLLNDFDNAIKDYSIVLLLQDDSNTYRNRALLYWNKGDHQNALLDLYAARNHFPEDSKLRGLLGLCLQKVSRNTESIEEFNVALQLDPYMREAFLGRGNVYASMNNLKLARLREDLHKAWDIFTIALTIDPKCTAALEGRSAIHLTMNNAFAAMVDITRAIEIMPFNAEFLTNRGVICQALNDDVSALHSYKAAIAADSTYELAYFNAANLYMRQQSWERAIKFFDKALQISSQDKAALLNRGICKIMLNGKYMTMPILGQYNDGALRDLDLAVIIDPNSPHIHFNRGHLLQSLGDYAQAEKAYTKVVELLPSDSAAFQHRGETRGFQSKWADAMNDYSRAIAAEDD